MPSLRLRFEARGQVDRIADDPVLAVAGRSSDYSGEDFAAVDSHAEARPAGMLVREPRGGFLEAERRARRGGGVVGSVAALIPDHHHRIADDLVDRAARPFEERHERREVAVEHLRYITRAR